MILLPCCTLLWHTWFRNYIKKRKRRYISKFTQMIKSPIEWVGCQVFRFSGACSTIETISNSELIDALLKHFALKMVGCSYDKTLTKNFENKTWISKIFVWLNCITELIFLMQKFFCSGHFWSFFPKMMDLKVTPAKKVSKMKNHFFHAR